LIPVILPAEKQAYLLHLNITKDEIIVESYVAAQYESPQDNSEQDDDFSLDLEDTPLSQVVIENLPGLVI